MVWPLRNSERSGYRASSRPRVLVSHQGCIPIYRKPFFARLNENSAIEFVVIHGRAPEGGDMIEASPPFPFPNIEVRNRLFKVAGRSVVWQPIVWRALRGEFVGAVIGEDAKYLSNLVLAFLLRLRGRPVLLWGFGYHQYDRPPQSVRDRVTSIAAATLKRMTFAIASGHLVYTEGGKRALGRRRVPLRRIAVLKNTVDTARERELRSKAAAGPIDRVVRELGVRSASIKLVYLGRMVATKRVELLVDYARRCIETGRNVDVIIVGRGSETSRLRSLAAALTNVTFHGPSDDLKLALALRVSAAVVIPGYVGLAVTHAFAHGVPILTCSGQLHSPEVEYVEHGVNGLMLPEDAHEFFTALDAFVDDRDLQRRLADGAERSGQTLDMDHMVDAFRGLVAECLASTARSAAE
jgi:glycosyltransferase involved in cell wall biosynthesis